MHMNSEKSRIILNGDKVVEGKANIVWSEASNSIDYVLSINELIVGDFESIHISDLKINDCVIDKTHYASIDNEYIYYGRASGLEVVEDVEIMLHKE